MRGVEACLELCSWLSGRLEDWLGMHSAKLPPPVLRRLEDRLAMAVTLLHQVRNRLLQGRRVPSPEKTCSVFEPHARWIGKGKAGCPQESGVPVAILEDQHPFIPGHRVSRVVEGKRRAGGGFPGAGMPGALPRTLAGRGRVSNLQVRTAVSTAVPLDRIPHPHAHLAIAFMTLICARHLQRRLRLRGRQWTAEALREILNRTRCTVETCAHTGRRFLSPLFMTPEAKQIYGACNAKWRRFKRELT